MAARVAMQQAIDFAPDCERIQAPTLIVTGEDDLDQIVPAEVTRRYRQLIPGSRYIQMKRSGHIGLLTHPAQFADIVSGFINGNGH
jgi:pimeloyl-ACP methyl ester carboxylesterase